MASFVGRTGGCQCGAVRYVVSGEPLMLYACHCSECRKQSASAFGLSLIVRPGDVEFTAGEDRLRRWDTHGDDGSLKSCHFCSDCGSRLLHGDLGGSEPVSISNKTMPHEYRSLDASTSMPSLCSGAM